VPRLEQGRGASTVAILAWPYSFHITLHPHCGQGAGGRSAWTASLGSGGLRRWSGLVAFSGLTASRPVVAGISRWHTEQIMRVSTS
jgi:hypothetical protein